MSEGVSTVGRDVAEYQGIKYSLQPHGLRSRLLVAFFSFVVAFGGALAVASPAQADDPPGTCYTAVPVTPTPESPTPPSVSPSPTTCPPTPTPVTTTVTVTVTTPIPGPTVTVTKTVTKTVYVDHTVTETQTEAADPSPSVSPSASKTPIPSKTPDPPAMKFTSGGGPSLVVWGVIVALVGGLALVVLGIIGIVRRRRYQGAHVLNEDEYDVDDYDPAEGEYDPALGGYAGAARPTNETMEIPRVGDDPGDAQTTVIPPVK